jgi:hypothetical protein
MLQEEIKTMKQMIFAIATFIVAFFMPIVASAQYNGYSYEVNSQGETRATTTVRKSVTKPSRFAHPSTWGVSLGFSRRSSSYVDWGDGNASSSYKERERIFVDGYNRAGRPDRYVEDVKIDSTYKQKAVQVGPLPPVYTGRDNPKTSGERRALFTETSRNAKKLAGFK